VTQQVVLAAYVVSLHEVQEISIDLEMNDINGNWYTDK
jgi:hypothetical protein